jgi:hypothetical protein
MTNEASDPHRHRVTWILRSCIFEIPSTDPLAAKRAGQLDSTCLE